MANTRAAALVVGVAGLAGAGRAAWMPKAETPPEVTARPGGALPAAPGAGGQAAPAVNGQAGPKRRDQFRCPLCREWGCPAEGGTKYDGATAYRYRRCKNPRCTRKLFRTSQASPTAEEKVIG